MDDVVGDLVNKFKEKGVWDNTLMVFFSDNGGPIYVPGSANNFPLKGGKYSDWEGGIRTNAFIAGGFVPKENRGMVYEGMISIADWYGMFAEFAGIEKDDTIAEAANVWLKEKNLPTLHPVDSVTGLWSKITSNKANRQILHASEKALIVLPHKLVVGPQPYSGWTGRFYPNCSQNSEKPFFTDIKLFDHGINASLDVEKVERMTWVQDCGSEGCLFNIVEDPNERIDLGQNPDFKLLRAQMLSTLQKMNENVFRPQRGELSTVACDAGIKNGGFYGPFVYADKYYTGPFPKEDFAKKIENAALKEAASFVANEIVQDALVCSARKTFPLIAAEFSKSLDKCEPTNGFYPEFEVGINSRKPKTSYRKVIQ